MFRFVEHSFLFDIFGTQELFTVSHHPNHPRHTQDKKKTQVHKDWRTWTIVILMLAGMAAYILTLDESVVPAVQPQEPMEAIGG